MAEILTGTQAVKKERKKELSKVLPNFSNRDAHASLISSRLVFLFF
jgi:hypothetical protein